MPEYTPVIEVPESVPTLCLKKHQIESVLDGRSWDRHTRLPLTELIGETFLLFTGAKARYLGGGFWAFFGYTSDQRDARLAMEAVVY
jgi:hypothetical protein